MFISKKSVSKLLSIAILTATLIITSSVQTGVYVDKVKPVLKVGWSATKAVTIVYCLNECLFMKDFNTKEWPNVSIRFLKNQIFFNLGFAFIATKSLYDDIKAFTKYRATQKEAAQETVTQ